jgi:hypothetical protein
MQGRKRLFFDQKGEFILPDWQNGKHRFPMLQISLM